MIDFTAISPVTFWLGTVFPAVIILVAPILVLAGFFHGRKARWWRRQPVAPGAVIAAEIVKAGRGRFRPHIVYRFHLGGRTYESSHFSHGQYSVTYGEIKAREIVDRYPVGTPLRVHYDPANPQRSLVETKSSAKYFYWGAVGVVLGMLVWAANFWAIELLAKR